MAVPILQGFRREFPDIFVDVSSQGFTGTPPMETDVAVIYDRPRTGTAVSDLLWMSRVTPGCSPALAEQHRGKSLPHFIADTELLHMKLEGEPPGLIWQTFSDHFALGLQTGRGLAFDTAALAAQYAVTGGGVALLDIDLFAQDIEAGALVTPFPETCEDGYGYFLNLAPEDLADPVISVFRSWMIRNFARSDRAA
jgi:LysR family glycine cleavage system transcriptional activator